MCANFVHQFLPQVRIVGSRETSAKEEPYKTTKKAYGQGLWRDGNGEYREKENSQDPELMASKCKMRYDPAD
jgi:hypothetical protein